MVYCFFFVLNFEILFAVLTKLLKEGCHMYSCDLPGALAQAVFEPPLNFVVVLKF